MHGAATGVRRPRYRTWIRRSRLILFAALSGVCLLGSGLAVLSPWFLLLLIPVLILVSLFPILAPVVVIGLLVYWLWWRKKKKAAPAEPLQSGQP